MGVSLENEILFMDSYDTAARRSRFRVPSDVIANVIFRHGSPFHHKDLVSEELGLGLFR